MSAVREIVVNTFVSLDGVMQAPGGPQEDPRDGFDYGGWIIDLGPGAGRIVFEGTPVGLVTARSTLTGEHLAAYVGA